MTENRTVDIAKRLLKILKQHASDAIDQEIPRDVYIRAVADHAACVYDSFKDDPPS